MKQSEVMEHTEQSEVMNKKFEKFASLFLIVIGISVILNLASSVLVISSALNKQHTVEFNLETVSDSTGSYSIPEIIVDGDAIEISIQDYYKFN